MNGLYIRGKKGSHKLELIDKTIKSTSSATLHSITIDAKLKFREHTHNNIQKTCYKLYGLPFKIRKIQNIISVHDRESVTITQCQLLLPMDLDILLKSRNLTESYKAVYIS